MARTKGREVPPAGAGRWRLEWGRSGGGAWRGSCYRAWLRAAAWSSEREQGKGRRAGATQATVCILGFVAFVGCQIARNRCSIGPMSQKRECMKICIKMYILINLFSQILGMPRHTGAYPWRRHCSRSLLPRSRAATMADLGLSSPISLHPPPPASISPPTRHRIDTTNPPRCSSSPIHTSSTCPHARRISPPACHHRCQYHKKSVCRGGISKEQTIQCPLCLHALFAITFTQICTTSFF